MKRSSRMLMAMVAFCCVLSFTNAGNTLAAGPIELSLQTIYHEPHQGVVKGFKPWMKTIEEQTNGRVKITFYPPNALVPIKDAYDNLVNGMVDMLGEGVFFRPDLFMAFQVTMLPFITSSAESFALLLPELLEKYPEMAAPLNETKLLFTWASAPTQLHTCKKLVKTLEDVQGSRIIVGDPQSVEYIKELGINPIEMMFTEVYMALQRNAAEGTFFPLAPTKSLKIIEVAKYHTMISLSCGPLFGLMNKDKFNQLPSDIQTIFEETTAALGTKLSQVLHEADAELIKELKADGHEFYDVPQAERNRWKEKVMPVVYEKLKKYEGRGVPNATKIYKEAVLLGAKYDKIVGK